jgi:hypothetical protein
MHRSRPAFLVLALGVAACSDSAGPNSRALIQLGGAEPQVGVIGQPVPTAPSVLVTDAKHRPIAGVNVTFEIISGGGALSTNTQMTSSTGIASAVWTLGNTFGPGSVEARVAGLPPVTFTVTAVAPEAGIVAFELVDPVGDTLAQSTTNLVAGIDLLSLHGDFKRDSLILTATFSRPITSAFDSPNYVTGIFLFDIDNNPLTGREYELDFSASGSRIPVAGSTGGSVQTSYSGNTLVLRIPMSMIGNDDGNFNITGLVGTADRGTDIIPNNGEISVRRMVGVSPTR